MHTDWNRRDFIELMGIGGVVFASALVAGCGDGAAASASAPASPPGAAPPNDFFFLQLSDTHWGFKGPSNPQSDVTLEHAVATINAVDILPDFVVFTGDLTHNTDDAGERKTRMARFREIVSALKVKDVRFLPGEHDAGLDHGDAFREAFGETHYAFDHKGVHFVALDNVSQPGSTIGDVQLQWLAADLARVPADVPLVVLTHRPLFDLYPEWDWATKDGAAALDILSRRDNVTIFYGHIHQENHRTTGRIAHHSSTSAHKSRPAVSTGVFASTPASRS